MPTGPPIATYRVQLNASLGFDQAAAIAAYLGRFGASHFYASPLTRARAGSMHGYDVVDYDALNPELGDESAFHRFVEALARADLGLLLDFVPNHMGVSHADNAWWLDVLEWGTQSPHAASFDIDWSAPLPGGGSGRLLLPILGTSYGEALERGAIALRYDASEGSFSAWYYEHRLPIAPSQYPSIIRIAVAAVPHGDCRHRALLAATTSYEREGAPTRETLRRFRNAVAEIGAADLIGQGLQAFSPAGGGSAALANLHCLLERQHYRLAYWRLAATDINYRRFFDITSLAGLRVEDPGTFAAVHRLLARLLARGDLQGLRIDHVDGLFDPARYFDALQKLIRARRPGGDLYVVMEKILGRDEPVPEFTGVAGTTGYEWLNVISRLLADGRGLAALDRIWRDASGEERDFGAILLDSKRHVLERILASELSALTRLLGRIAAGHYRTRDYSARELDAALTLFLLHFPVYRTYVTAAAGASPADRRIIEQALAQARSQWIGADNGIFEFLRDALTLDLIRRTPRCHSVARVQRFAAKVQQLTGPLMAKSLEDTAFYRHHRLIAFNEVGGDPDAGALSVAEFHALMRARSSTWPHGLTATATHDTKRGEDARARLVCLSEMPAEWAQAVATWRGLNEHLRDRRQCRRAPSDSHEYMLYQSLLGAWPPEGSDPTLSERMQAFAIKAAREGKEQTSWLDPDQAYEAALRRFVGGMLDPGQSAAFLESFGGFAARVALTGALNSLSQVTLKCTMPGVPDFYQGTEFWDLSLVDPDNRRPVDFSRRAAALAQSSAGTDWSALLRDWRDGRIKLALTARLLAVRRRFAEVFAEGDYRALEVTGRHRDEVVAFARCRGDLAIIVVVTRLPARRTRFGSCWPARDWDASVALGELAPRLNLLLDRPMHGGPALGVAELLDGLPVAILQADAARSRS